jgi:hypothetical protein
MCAILAKGLAAQFYIQVNTGYSVSTHPFTYVNRVITDNIINQFRIKLNYGHGFNLGLSAGYEFSDNFFAEVNLSSSLISRSRSDNDWGYYFRREYLNLHLSGLNGDAEMRNTSLQLAPLLGFSVSAGRFKPFIKAGLNILYLKSRYSNSYTYKYLDENHAWYLEITELKREYTGKIKPGVRGCAGVLYRLTEDLLLSAELSAVNSMYQFDKSHTLSFIVDGVERVDEIEENPEKLDDGDGTVDHSNIGLNIGIRYTF